MEHPIVQQIFCRVFNVFKLLSFHCCCSKKLECFSHKKTFLDMFVSKAGAYQSGAPYFTTNIFLVFNVDKHFSSSLLLQKTRVFFT